MKWSSSTSTTLPTAIKGTISSLAGPTPTRNAQNGLAMATTAPHQTPPTSVDTPSTRLTQEPVTNWPSGLVAHCSATSRAIITAVSAIQ